MVKRLFHFLLTGHKWRLVSSVFNKPSGYSCAYSWHEQMAAWGFTEFLWTCECGATREKQLLGDHSGVKASDELAELEKMMRGPR